MEAKLTVNGFGFVARYGEKDVEHVLLPLLWRWTELQKERGERLVVMLAAPPGAGKSTLAAFMEWLSRRTPEAMPPQAVGMDGFHYPTRTWAHTRLLTRTDARFACAAERARQRPLT